jgi:MFS transporter, DHA3 family, macrolide efflux protein
MRLISRVLQKGVYLIMTNPQTPAAASGAGALFRNRVVQVIMMSGVFLQLGIWIRNFAILLFVSDQTNNDPVAISLISVAEFSPIFLFSFIGGTFADRWKPKLTMVWCDLLSAVSVFVVLLTLVYGSWRAVFFATFISAILSQFSQPSGLKLFKLHVPESLMQMGMSMFQTMMAVFMIIGPMLGSYVYFTFGINWAIGIMGVCFLLSAAVLALLPSDKAEDRKDTSHLWEDMKLGFRYVLARKQLVCLGGSFLAAGLAIGLISPLGIFLVEERLGESKDFLQWFMVANGAAMIVGGGLTLGLSRKLQPQVLLIIGMLVNAACFAFLGVTTQTWLALVIQFVSGLVMPAIQIGINTMILKNTEEAYVGRVNGILSPLFMGAMVIMMSLAGYLKSVMTLPPLYMISAAMFVAGVGTLLPILRAPNEQHSAGSDNMAESNQEAV